MVLVNGLTIDDINAALIALQRSRTEVVGGEKGTTVQNISVSNTSSGGGKNYDLQILQLQNDVKAVDEKIGQVQSETNGRINELSSRLADLQVEQLSWNESNRILTLITAGGDYDVQIPSETVTLSLNSSNELTFTMGVNENNNPQTVKVTLPYIRTTEKGIAGGVASLDSSGRVPYSQLPESAMEFKGEWDASINYPHLEDGTGTNGDFYICSAGGTVNFGTVAEPRNITFYPNDRVIYEGSNAQWFRLPAGEVRTVNGMSGDVVLTANNIMYDSNQTIKQKIDSAAQADWTETDSADPSFIKNKIPIWITSGSADDNMSPIDSVTDGSMRPITSNAVYDALGKVKLVQNADTNTTYPTENNKVEFYQGLFTSNAPVTRTSAGLLKSSRVLRADQSYTEIYQEYTVLGISSVGNYAPELYIRYGYFAGAGSGTPTWSSWTKLERDLDLTSVFNNHFLTVDGASGGTVYVKIRLKNYNKQGGQSVFCAYNCFSEWGVMRESSQCYYRGASYGVMAISWTNYTVDNDDFFWVKFSGWYNIQFVCSKEMEIAQRTTTAPSGITFTNKVAWT